MKKYIKSILLITTGALIAYLIIHFDKFIEGFLSIF